MDTDSRENPGYIVVTTLLAHEPREHLSEAGMYAFTADVTKDGDVQALLAQVTKIGEGCLDVLVNNA